MNPEAPKQDGAPGPRGRGWRLDSSDSLAYVPHPGGKPVERRGPRALPALIAAGALAAAAIYFHQTNLPASGAPPVAREIEVPSSEPAPLQRINAAVVDHYNPMIRAQRRPDLESRKVQFNNGVYSVVPPDTRPRSSGESP